MTTIAPVPPSTTPSPSIAITFERWLAERPENRGIVPPWLEPGKAWPPMPEPRDD